MYRQDEVLLLDVGVRADWRYLYGHDRGLLYVLIYLCCTCLLDFVVRGDDILLLYVLVGGYCLYMIQTTISALLLLNVHFERCCCCCCCTCRSGSGITP